MSRTPELRAASANSGSSPRNVCSPEWMSSPDRIAARITARQSSGSRPPVGAIPISSAVGAGQEPERLVEAGHDRDVEAARVAQPLADVAPGLGRVDHGDDPVGPEADDAHGGLAVVEAEVALGEDHEAAIGGGRHVTIPVRTVEPPLPSLGHASGRRPGPRVSRPRPPARHVRPAVLVSPRGPGSAREARELRRDADPAVRAGDDRERSVVCLGDALDDRQAEADPGVVAADAFACRAGTVR